MKTYSATLLEEKKFMLGYAEIHYYQTLPGVDLVTCTKTMIRSHARMVYKRIAKCHVYMASLLEEEREGTQV